MIAAFGERAKRWASGATIDDDVIAADESAFLEAILEGVRRRLRGETFATAMLVDEDQNRFSRNWGAQLLAATQTFDERRAACGAILMNAVVVDGRRMPELSGVTPDTLQLGRTLWHLGERAVVISEASYAQQAMIFGRWHASRIRAGQDDPSVPRPAGERDGSEHVVVWAGTRSADEIAIVLCAVEELHVPVYVVCEDGGVPETVHRCSIEQAEPLLRSAAAIVDTTYEHPGTARALARFGVPVASPYSSGAHESIAGIASFDAWNRDSILAAVLRALGAPAPRVLTVTPSRASAPAAAKARAPLVSVITPTYNRRALLPRALESIKAQRYPSVEMVVVNDAGEDIRDIVDRFGGRIVVREANGGHGAALNDGIAQARGEYVAFLDDDDVFFPDHIASLVDGVASARAKAAHSNALMAVRGAPDEVVGFSPGQINGVDLEEALVVCPFLGMIAALIHRDVFAELGGFDAGIAPNDDYEMVLRIALRYDWAHVDRITCLWSYGGEYTHWLQKTGVAYAGLYEEAYKRHPFPDRPLLAARRRQFVESIRATSGIRLNVVGTRLEQPAHLHEFLTSK